MPTFTKYDTTRRCDGSGPTAAEGFCSYFDGATKATRGTVVDLAAAVCRLPGQGDGTLTASNGRYAEFAVSTNADGTLWDWSTGRHFGDRGRDFVVPAGRCARFAVRWNLSRDDGKPLPPGTYDVEAYPDVATNGVYVGGVGVAKITIT